MRRVGAAFARVVVMPLVAMAGLFILAAPLQAGPVAPQGLAVAAPAVTLVRDYCGRGFHRDNKQRDKWGAWRGKCVPNKPKKASPSPVDAPRPSGSSG